MRYLYLCLVYHDEAKLDALPDGEYERLVAGALAYREELRRSGHLVAAEALEPSRTARTLRGRGGGFSATDGPFAETKEQVGGFILIRARDLDEAVELASRFPPLRVGSLEVRPIRDLERREPGARR